VERLLDAVPGEEIDFLCAPKLKPRKRNPRIGPMWFEDWPKNSNLAAKNLFQGSVAHGPGSAPMRRSPHPGSVRDDVLQKRTNS
jgi:hypothetical protein